MNLKLHTCPQLLIFKLSKNSYTSRSNSDFFVQVRRKKTNIFENDLYKNWHFTKGIPKNMTLYRTQNSLRPLTSKICTLHRGISAVDFHLFQKFRFFISFSHLNIFWWFQNKNPMPIYYTRWLSWCTPLGTKTQAAR